MADFDIEQLKEQTEAAEKLNEIYKKLTDGQISFKQALQERLTQEATLEDSLRKQLGAQTDLLRAGELKQEVLNDVLAREEEILKISKEYQKLKAGKEKDNLTQIQKQRLAELKTVEDILAIDEDKRKELEEQVKALREQKKVLDEIQAKQENVDSLLENEFKQRTGLVTSSQSLAQEMVRISAEGGKSFDFLNAAAEKMNKQLTTANMLNSAMAKMGELGDNFNKTMLDSNGLLMEMAQADIQFVRDTGLTEQLGDEVKSLRYDFNDLNFLAAETDQAFRGLTQSFTGFTEVGADTRRELTEGAAILERFGVTSDATGQSVDSFTKAMGKTPQAAMKTTKEMVKFARALGVGPNKLMGDLNQNFEIFAEFGDKKGVQIFKKLQTAAKQTGIEFSKLTGIVNKFDQSIEGTMEAAGDLNFLLGGPFINSMELLEAEGPEKFEILRNALDQSGKSFDDMGRRQKKAFADLLGVDMETASRFFKGQAGDIDAATAAVEGQAGKMKDLGKEAAENILLKEKDQLAQEAQTDAMKDLGDVILKVNQTIKDLQKTFAPLMTLLGGLASAASFLFSTLVNFKVLTGGKSFFGEGGPLTNVGKKFKDLGKGAGALKLKLSNSFKSIGKSMGGAFNSASIKGKNAFKSISKSVGNTFNDMKIKSEVAFEGMKDKIKDFASSALKKFTSMKDGIKQFASGAVDKLKSAFGAGKQAVSNFASMALEKFALMKDGVSSFASSALEKFTSMKDGVSSFASDAAQNAAKTGTAWITTAKATALAWLATAKQTIIGWVGMAKSAITNAAQTASSWISSATAAAASWLRTAATAIGGFISMAATAITNGAAAAAAWVGAAVSTLSAWAATAAGFIAAAASMIVAAAPIILPILAIGAAITGIVVFWDELVGAFSAGFDFLKSAFSGYLDFIKEGFKAFLHGLVIFAEVIAHAVTLPFTAIIEGAAALADLVPGTNIGDSIRAFSPGRIIRTYASEIHASINAFESGKDGTDGNAFIAGDSSTGAAKPELVVAPPMSSVINNKNLNTIASMMKNQTAAVGGPSEANVNITLKLDEKVLARHTEKVTLNTVKEVFSQSR